MKRTAASLIILSILLIFAENLFAKGRGQLSSFLRNINGSWEETDTINGNIHRTVWTFDKLVDNSGSGNLTLYINDSLSHKTPQPFVWMMHELKDGIIVMQIRFYKDKIEYPLWEIQSITKKELHFTAPNYILKRVDN